MATHPISEPGDPGEEKNIRTEAPPPGVTSAQPLVVDLLMRLEHHEGRGLMVDGRPITPDEHALFMSATRLDLETAKEIHHANGERLLREADAIEEARTRLQDLEDRVGMTGGAFIDLMESLTASQAAQEALWFERTLAQGSLDRLANDAHAIHLEASRAQRRISRLKRQLPLAEADADEAVLARLARAVQPQPDEPPETWYQRARTEVLEGRHWLAMAPSGAKPSGPSRRSLRSRP